MDKRNGKETQLPEVTYKGLHRTGRQKWCGRCSIRAPILVQISPILSTNTEEFVGRFLPGDQICLASNLAETLFDKQMDVDE